MSTLSWLIAILIAFYELYVNDVTRLPSPINSATRRDVIKFSLVVSKDITIRFANERAISLVYRVTEHSQSRPDSKFQLSSACFSKTDIPKLFTVDTFESSGCERVAGTSTVGLTLRGRAREGETDREGEGGGERERESFTARVSNPESRSQQHLTARKRRSKVNGSRAGRVARVRG